MPKRKRSKKYEEDLDSLRHKIRKLQRKIQSRGESVSSHSGSIEEDFVLQEASPLLRPDDWFPDYPDNDLVHNALNPDMDQQNPIEDQQNFIKSPYNPTEDEHNPVEDVHNPDEDREISVQSALIRTQPQGLSTDKIPNLPTEIESASTSKLPENDTVDLDDDVLLILGDDPSSSLIYGKEIRKEIATRFSHIATEGTTKEMRRDLISKYPIPANCLYIGAPKLNPEIKAAISENFAKRDKGIETKQKEMACAIACVGEMITSQLNAKDRNNDLLQKHMDLSRILCDIQHADSVTRRNFILFGLKKDLKDHLVNTKIDTFLFGENLTETLRTAKAVNRSVVEIKAAAPKQAPTTRPKSVVYRPLNRRGPAPRRPPPGPPPPGPPPPAPVPRGRAPAPRAPPPPPPARYYRTSYAHQPPQRRY